MNDKQVIRTVAAYYNVTVEELTGPRRLHTNRPRHVAMWLLRRRGRGLKTIGEMFNRDHTTALYGINAVEADNDPDFYRQLEILEARTADHAGWQPRPATEADARIAAKFAGCKVGELFR